MNLDSLLAAYQTDPDSTFQKIRPQTRGNNRNLCRRIARDYGRLDLAEVNARVLLRCHEHWTGDGHIAMGHTLMGMLRTVCSFGATILEDRECERLCGVLHKMRFQMSKPRQEIITAEQAAAIRAEAHKAGLHSIALAQAFQFDGTLRQKDVIGEYVGEQWARGLVWEEIDENLILRHVTSKRQKEIELNLRLAPMVMEEFERLPYLPSAGPVIVTEADGKPYRDYQFRRAWRELARQAGVPDEVFNMDSRAGAITEALNSGARLQSVRKAATHSNESMTQRYSRGDAAAIEEVMQLRAAHRMGPAVGAVQ